MDCTAAAHRLRVGVPATVEHAAEESGNGADMAKQVAETTQVRRDLRALPPLPAATGSAENWLDVYVELD